jgi:hypothetical protein
MRVRGVTRRVVGAAAIAMGLAAALAAHAQETKKIKIGVIYDYSGPFAGGGSELHALGAKIMLDHFIKQGGSKATRSSRSMPTPKASPMWRSTRRCA